MLFQHDTLFGMSLVHCIQQQQLGETVCWCLDWPLHHHPDTCWKVLVKMSPRGVSNFKLVILNLYNVARLPFPVATAALDIHMCNICHTPSMHSRVTKWNESLRCWHASNPCRLSSHCWVVNHLLYLWTRSLISCHLLSSESSIAIWHHWAVRACTVVSLRAKAFSNYDARMRVQLN